MYCKQRNVCQNPPTPKGCNEKEIPIKWEQISWFLLHENTPAHLSLVVKKYLAKHNVSALEHVLPPDFFLFLQLKSVLKGQQFVRTEDVTANVTRALTEVSKNGFQECFQKLYGHWQKCHCPSKLLGHTCHVNRLKVTYLSVINPFWELFKATCTINILYCKCKFVNIIEPIKCIP
jgi:hypothetical protein